MKQYNIFISKNAKADINSIYVHIRHELKEPETAERQKKRIIDNIKKLDMMPKRIKIMESEPEHSLEIRRLLVDNYSVFYFIRNNDVIVTRVLYSMSDIEKKLLV